MSKELAQRLYDMSVEGVIRQGRRSHSPQKRACMYRGPDGLKCAVGHVIPDEYYNSLFEGCKFSGTRVQTVLVQIYGKGMYDVSGMLSRLQTAHDRIGLGDGWLTNFKLEAVNIARMYDLTPHPLALGDAS